MKTKTLCTTAKKVLAALFVALLLIQMAPPALAASTKYVVTASTLNVRKSNSTKSAKIATLKKGATVTVTGSTRDWYIVKVNGKKGYVAKEYVKKASSNNTTSKSSSSSSSNTKTLKQGSSGAQVKKLQERLRKLGYLSSKSVTGKYNSTTVKAVKHFQMQAGLTINGKADSKTQKKLYSSSAPKKKDIVTMDWFKSGINGMFSRRSTATIIDCSTGTRIKIRRVYGTNHADVEPATAADTAKLKKIYGGKWSWSTRAVILVVGGRYIAASINSMPHGDEISKTNDYDGQFCLHTTGSKTHGTDCVNSNHQSKVEKASKYLS